MFCFIKDVFFSPNEIKKNKNILNWKIVQKSSPNLKMICLSKSTFFISSIVYHSNFDFIFRTIGSFLRNIGLRLFHCTVQVYRSPLQWCITERESLLQSRRWPRTHSSTLARWHQLHHNFITSCSLWIQLYINFLQGLATQRQGVHSGASTWTHFACDSQEFVSTYYLLLKRCICWMRRIEPNPSS